MKLNFPIVYYSSVKDTEDRSKKTNHKKIATCPNSSTLPLNSFNKYLVNFNGLSGALSKKAYESADLIKAEMLKDTKSNGIVGNLPSVWIEKIPVKERKARIKNFYDDLRVAVVKFRENQNNEELTKKFNYALQKAKIIGEKEKLSIEHLDDGNYGSGYLIKDVFDNQFMIKIFHMNDVQNDFHGNYTEINRAMYWRKNAGINQKVISYFGDINAGYMVNEYIGRKTPEYKGKIVPEEIFGLENFDSESIANGHNKIKGYQIDYGGLKVQNHLLAENKTVRYVYKKLYYTEEDKKWQAFLAFLNDKKYKHNNDIRLGLVSAISILPEKARIDGFNELLNRTHAEFNDDNRIKLGLISKIKILPEKGRYYVFEELLKNSDNEIKIGLADNLSLLSEKNKRLEFFEKLSKDADKDLKQILAINLNSIPEEGRVAQFSNLLKNADKELKITLAKKLYLIPKGQDAFEIFKKIARNADNEIKMELAEALNYLPTKEKVEQFNILIKNSDNKVKNILAKNISIIPASHRVEGFENLLKSADSTIKITLANSIKYLPKDSAKVAEFEKLSKDADEKVKVALANNLLYLPVKAISEQFNNLYRFAGQELRIALEMNRHYFE